MKLTAPAPQDVADKATAQQQIQLPSGLIGFPNFKSAEIAYRKEEHPFMWLREVGGEKISFIVVEPAGLVKGYEVEVTDADVEALGLQSSADALVLNIATLHTQKGKNSISLNLIGPVVINRRTLVGRQIIIGNCQKYSARHPLFETE